MAERRGRDLAVGAMFTLALVVLALGIMAVGEDSNFLKEDTEYVTVFPNADGLLVGAPVRMAGVQIGTVASIRLPTDPAREGITVRFGVDPSYTERIRDDSKAGLRILQILTGEKFVEVSPGSPTAEPLPPGASIPAEEQREILAQGYAIAEDLTDITHALRDILEPLQEGKGLLGGMIQDPEFGKEGLEAMRGSLENLEAITGELRAGRGAMGRLLTDEQLGAKLDDLARAIEELSTFAAELNRGTGALGELMREDGAGERAIHDLAEAAATLERVATRIESGESAIGSLLAADCADSGRSLCDTLRNLSEVTGKINRGEGTLGALVNERTLHDSAEEVVAGVNDSRFARWLLRHYRKKGIKADPVDTSDEGAAGDSP
jgi:phospholipid/cholesterol/gamma-HCH transport system substrate-binding protein